MYKNRQEQGERVLATRGISDGLAYISNKEGGTALNIFIVFSIGMRWKATFAINLSIPRNFPVTILGPRYSCLFERVILTD